VFLWRSDLYRYSGSTSPRSFVETYAASPGFRYTVYHRLFHELFDAGDGELPPMLAIARRLASLWLRRYSYRFGIEIPIATQLGPGFYIGHHGEIVLSPRCRIGRNCNISHGVTIGQAARRGTFAWPTLGDSVYVGPGAKLFGDIHVGDHAAIGANAVVTADVPAGSVVGGVPARVISDQGSWDYIERPWPPSAGEG
jgi:serine O-acetyltransferase